MKIMNKFQKKLANRKKDNKGFSLVELIIVIAIMAILVGIVGTQVIPYINKSKEAKDVQLVNSYSTAAVSAYSMLAGEITETATPLEINVYTDKSAAGAAEETKTDKNKLADKIIELTGYNDNDALKGKMASKKGNNVSGVKVTYDFNNHTVTTEALGTGLDEVKADL